MDTRIDIIRCMKENFSYQIKITVSNKNQIIGQLVPIKYADIGDESLLELLTKWRNENYDAYPSQFNATIDRTRRWLAKYVLEHENKILFLLIDNCNQIVGHMGLANYNSQLQTIEMDNIVRGGEKSQKGIITNALYDLISWTFLSFPVNNVYLKVFSDNERAINLYKRLKFIETKKIPLKKSNINNEVKFSEIDDYKLADRYFSQMELSRAIHFNNYSIKYGE